MALHQTAAAPVADEVLTKSGVAALLSVSTRQVENLTRDGRIPAPVYLSERAPRWVKADLIEWLRGKAAEGAG